MKRKVLLFFAMLCVSIGTWAYSSPTQTFDDGSTFAASDEGIDTQVFTVTAGGIAAWYAAADDAQKSAMASTASRVKLKITGTLSNADLQALGEACFNKFTSIDMSGATLADGASISNIKAGSAIEAVVLPNGLAKKDVNAAGAALAECNANFGSCLSRNTAVTEAQVTNYYYTEGSRNGQKVVESATVTLDKENLKATVKEDVQVDLKLEDGYPQYTFTNPYTNSTVVIDDPGNISGGQYTPATLEVNVTAVTTYTYNGRTVNSWEVVERDGKWYFQDWAAGNYGASAGTEVTASTTWTYSYNGQNYPYTEDETHPVVNGVGTIDNTQSFGVSSLYLYTYVLDGKIEEYRTNSEDTDLKLNTTHDVTYAVEARNEVEVTSDNNVIAYVNTEGTMYKATALAGISASSNIKNVTISGKINNGDISWGGWSGSSDDPQGSQNDADKYDSNGAVPALVNHQGAPTSIDMSDAVIDNYRHLRVLNGWGASLESVVFPKTVTRIPNYCCYSMGNNGNKNLSEIVFPTEAATLEIGDYAFHHCAVASLLFPSSTTSVGNYAFATAPNITDVEMQGLTNDCTFGNNVFDGCGALKHVTLSENTQNIGDFMFNQCGLLESIRIPTTCKTIGEKAFCECYSIHEVTIPEGVELIKVNAFELSGLTDIYVMATSPDKVPKIYAMSPTGDGPSTFSYQRTTGNNTAPNKTADEWASADYDEVMSWYQDEMSGPKGLGTGNALAALHYPESMKPFYESIDITKVYTAEELTQFTTNGLVDYFTPDEYLAFVTSEAQKAQIQGDITNRKVDPTTSTVTVNEATRLTDPVTHEELPLLYLPQTYAIDPYQNGSNPLQGPDNDNRYYPAQSDFIVRMAAGATGTNSGGTDNVASQWGWRQFPLSSSVEEIGEIPFQKEYDDTWYTMCFPWQMIDNQLFSAFNQKLEIVEFKGAEVFQDPEDEYNYNLVFHFDEVAKAYYTDSEGVEYDRVRDGNKVDGAGHNLYIYTSKDGNNTVVSCPDEVLASGYNPKTASEAVREQYGKYLSIQNVMVKPGHPYMIHPSIGAAPGNPATVYINGVKKIEPGEGLYASYANLAEVAESQKVEYTVTSKEAGSTAEAEAWKNPKTGKGGKYTFIGNINDEVNGDKGAQDMPTQKGPVYFLGVKEGYYPQFFKKPKGKGAKKWSQYSAIIVPDDDAIANVEGLDGMSASSGTATPAKGYDVVFGEWEIVDEATVVTAIENAQAEAEETGKPAQITHMNVVYNIKGQVVRADSSSVEGLPKGLYIVNGKKYMVK